VTRDRTTSRWWFATFVALVGGAVGVLTGRGLFLSVGVVAIAYATYGRVATWPSVSVAVDRSLSNSEPVPGAEVTVSVTVENAGGPVADLRLIDGVPGALAVVDGSPRHATSLRPGETTSFSYTVRAERGQHGFDPLTVVARDPSGTMERETTADAKTILGCQPALSDVPLGSQTTQYTGRLPTETGGSGLEFYATREYRPGDALSRIDWNRWARTGDLTTVDFREERAAEVMLVVDARAAAYRTRAPDERHAVAHAVAAASRVFGHLLRGGDRVGITTLGSTDCWLAPGAGVAHEHRARRLLGTHPALSYAPPDGPDPEPAIHPDHDPVEIAPLLSRLSADTQVILFSPLCDDASAEAAVRIAAHDRVVTVVAPDVTTTTTPGRRLARIQRRNRLHRLRRANVRIVDWRPDVPFSAALARAEARG
jgi:uncharacterized protein (DUF58 family)